MSGINLKAGTDTPRVEFDYENGTFEISGRSIPENVHDFFEPILTSVSTYFDNPQTISDFTFKLDFLNSASSKIIQDLFQILKNQIDKGVKIKINWFYRFDDEDMKDLGDDLKEDFQIPMEFIVF